MLCLQALQAPACHENMVKVGGYILGEFGNLIAGDQRSSPLVQFQLLHSKVSSKITYSSIILEIFITSLRWMFKTSVCWCLNTFAHTIFCELVVNFETLHTWFNMFLYVIAVSLVLPDDSSSASLNVHQICESLPWNQAPNPGRVQTTQQLAQCGCWTAAESLGVSAT